MAEFKKSCTNCRDSYCAGNSERCRRCSNDYSLWTPQKWFTDWLNSFDTSSATKCFEAVNLLKQRLEEKNEEKE